MSVAVAIFAHQEERRIAACLRSLPLDRPDTIFHVLVNGSRDATAVIAMRETAGRENVQVHGLHPGGKARTWNRFVRELEPGDHEAFIFLDGDAEIAPGSLDALVATLAADDHANAAAGIPLNGRRHLAYQQAMRDEGGLFGDLYALSGRFVAQMRRRDIRLPDDLIGDDGLLAALAATNLRDESNWDRRRVLLCMEAGFRCEDVRASQPSTWRMQYRRMINYSVRHFQNRIISDIMRGEGPSTLPRRLADLYPQWLPRFRPRRGVSGWFDRLALRRMRRQIERT